MATKKITKNQAISLCYYYMVSADGIVHPNEIEWIRISPIAQKYKVLEHLGWFQSVIKGKEEQMARDVVEKIMKENTLKSLPKKQRDEIAGDLLLLSAADGEIDKSEIAMHVVCYILLGGTPDEYEKLINQKKNAPKKRNKTTKTSRKQSVQFNKTPPASGDVKLDDSGGCFVATATMGDYNHPVVLDLRAFRDETLKNSIAGRIFIYVYYKIGPLFASIIKESSTLRKLSLKFLIKPLHSLVNKK